MSPLNMSTFSKKLTVLYLGALVYMLINPLSLLSKSNSKSTVCMSSFIPPPPPPPPPLPNGTHCRFLSYISAPELSSLVL